MAATENGAEQPTREQAEAAWWADWWALAPTWDMLARRAIAGDGGVHGERTLQDYWRRDPIGGAIRDDEAMIAAGELIRDPHGQLWHLAHVPFRWLDGSAAKSGWDAKLRGKLYDLIGARVRVATASCCRSSLNETKISGKDGRAQLNYVVFTHTLRSFSAFSATIHVAAAGAFIESWQALELDFGPAADFSHALFVGTANFFASRFRDGVSFWQAVFLDSVEFSFIRVSGTFILSGARIFGDVVFSKTRLASVNIMDAVVHGSLSFTESRFLNETRFDRSAFKGEADFSWARFSEESDPSFLSCSFSDVSFFRAAFSGRAYFIECRFFGRSSFKHACFKQGPTFSQAAFGADVDFGDAVFIDRRRFRTTGFEAVSFAGAANFAGARFRCSVNFRRSRFASYGCFGKAAFATDALFDAARFEGNADFGDTTFYLKGRPDRKYLPRMSFHGAVFGKVASFSDAAFRRPPSGHSGAFAGARFADLADFRGTGNFWIAALDEASFEKTLLLDDPDEAVALRQFDREILPAAIEGGLNIHTHETYLKELEGGCRTVKVVMGRARDELVEQRHYRFQLKARRRQPGTPWFGKAASWAYGSAADYGLSFGRPLLGIGLVVIVFTLIFAVFRTVATGAPLGWDEIGGAAQMSLSRVFPFGAFELVTKEWIASIASARESGWELVARMLATSESLIATMLVFLFALALRRRFQIG